MCTFSISRALYDQVIDLISGSNGWIISNEDVRNYPLITERRFTHRNIDVVTLALYLAVLEQAHQDKFEGQTLEVNFDETMRGEYAACNNFLTAKAEEAANHRDGLRGLVFSDEDWEMVDLVYHYLAQACAELGPDESDVEAQIVNALNCQAAIKNGGAGTGVELDDGTTPADLEKSRDAAEDLLTILILTVIEASEIEYDDEEDDEDVVGDAVQDHEDVADDHGADGDADDSGEVYGKRSPINALCLTFAGVERQNNESSFESDASDRLKGIREAAYLLRDTLSDTFATTNLGCPCHDPF